METNRLWKIKSLIDPDKLNRNVYTVIGAGSIGSNVVDLLARLGVNKIEVFDGDTVEDHNLCNQIYGLTEINVKKVLALQSIIRRNLGVSIDIHAKHWTPDDVIDGEVVFVCVDSMQTRREIVAGARDCGCTLAVEARLGSNEAHVRTFNPQNSEHERRWLDASSYSDEDARGDSCGIVTLPQHTSLVAGLSVWQAIKVLQDGMDIFSEHELLLGVDPFKIITNNW